MNTEQQLKERAEARLTELFSGNHETYIRKAVIMAMIDFHKQELPKLGKVIYVPVEITDDDDIPFKIQVDGKWCWLKKLTLSGEESSMEQRP